MSQQYKREVTIKYSRHPYRKDGTQDTSLKETVTWFTTIYDNNERMSDGRAKDMALIQFNAQKISFIKVHSIRVSKKVAY